MGRNGGDPIEQDRVKDEAGDEAQPEGLAGALFKESEKERDKRHPDQEGKAEFRKGQAGQNSAQDGQENITRFDLQLPVQALDFFIGLITRTDAGGRFQSLAMK